MAHPGFEWDEDGEAPAPFVYRDIAALAASQAHDALERLRQALSRDVARHMREHFAGRLPPGCVSFTAHAAQEYVEVGDYSTRIGYHRVPTTMRLDATLVATAEFVEKHIGPAYRKGQPVNLERFGAPGRFYPGRIDFGSMQEFQRNIITVEFAGAL